MTAERLARIEELFHGSLELEGAARECFLDQGCAGDPVLRAEVTALLNSTDDTVTSLQAQIGSVAERAYVAEISARTHAGPYRILRQLGHGGMGEVYLAERSDDFTRQVALKLVRTGLSGSEEILARFRAERQILANLNHPNIAKLLDGGVTEAGIPYIAMEYVEGVPIDAFVRERGLSIPALIGIFKPICHAVQHAHQNLIVHRDLKPGNILVTADGTPKLLDFGIAKLLEEGTPLLTRASERLLTPEYASPEQVQGLPVTTASDVYALGILLYELLTNQRPFATLSLTPFELSLAVCERQPPAPGTLVKLDADLDQIVLKAIRKEPQHRYASVAELVADLERYLGGYPVVARHGSWRYTAVKYVRRNRVPLAAAALITVALGWGGLSTYLAEQKAARRFSQVRELANRSLFEFEESIERLPGATPARALLVKRGLEYLDGLAKESSGDLELQDELARGYEKLRIVQYGVQVGHLGDVAGAARSARKAAELREAILAARPNDPKALDDLAYARQTTGQVAFSTGRIADALPELLRAMELGKRALQLRPNDVGISANLGDTYALLGQLEVKLGSAPEALRYMDAALEIARRRVAAERTPVTLNALAQSLISEGDVYRTVTGEQEKALVVFRKALELENEGLQLTPGDAGAIHNRNLASQRMGLTLSNMGDYRGALEYLNNNLVSATEALATDPTSAMHQRGMSVAQINVADALIQLNDTKPAIELCRKAVLIRRSRCEAAPKDMQARDDLSNALWELGTALDQASDYGAARSALEEARHMREALLAEDPSRADIKLRMGRVYLALQQHAIRRRDCKAARASYLKATTVFAELSQAHKMGGSDMQYPKQADALIATCPPN